MRPTRVLLLVLVCLTLGQSILTEHHTVSAGGCATLNCTACVNDAAVCTECDRGLFLSSPSQCGRFNCSSSGLAVHAGCTLCARSTGAHCRKCEDGWHITPYHQHIDPSREYTCSQECNENSQAHASCTRCSSNTTCVACEKGTRLVGGRCLEGFIELDAGAPWLLESYGRQNAYPLFQQSDSYLFQSIYTAEELRSWGLEAGDVIDRLVVRVVDFQRELALSGTNIRVLMTFTDEKEFPLLNATVGFHEVSDGQQGAYDVFTMGEVHFRETLWLDESAFLSDNPGAYGDGYLLHELLVTPQWDGNQSLVIGFEELYDTSWPSGGVQFVEVSGAIAERCTDEDYIFCPTANAEPFCPSRPGCSREPNRPLVFLGVAPAKQEKRWGNVWPIPGYGQRPYRKCFCDHERLNRCARTDACMNITSQRQACDCLQESALCAYKNCFDVGINGQDDAVHRAVENQCELGKIMLECPAVDCAEPRWASGPSEFEKMWGNQGVRFVLIFFLVCVVIGTGMFIQQVRSEGWNSVKRSLKRSFKTVSRRCCGRTPQQSRLRARRREEREGSPDADSPTQEPESPSVSVSVLEFTGAALSSPRGPRRLNSFGSISVSRASFGSVSSPRNGQGRVGRNRLGRRRVTLEGDLEGLVRIRESGSPPCVTVHYEEEGEGDGNQEDEVGGGGLSRRGTRVVFVDVKDAFSIDNNTAVNSPPSTVPTLPALFPAAAEETPADTSTTRVGATAEEDEGAAEDA